MSGSSAVIECRMVLAPLMSLRLGAHAVVGTPLMVDRSGSITGSLVDSVMMWLGLGVGHRCGGQHQCTGVSDGGDQEDGGHAILAVLAVAAAVFRFVPGSR